MHIHQRSPSSKNPLWNSQQPSASNDDFEAAAKGLSKPMSRPNVLAYLAIISVFLFAVSFTSSRMFSGHAELHWDKTCPEPAVCPTLECPVVNETQSQGVPFDGESPLIIVPTKYDPSFFISMHHPKDDSPRASLFTDGKVGFYFWGGRLLAKAACWTLTTSRRSTSKLQLVNFVSLSLPIFLVL